MWGANDRRYRDAALREGALAQGARAEDEMGAASQRATARDRGTTRWRVYHSWQGSWRPGPRAPPVITTSGGDDAGLVRSHLGWSPRPDGAPRIVDRALSPLRHHLVSRRHP